MSQIPDDASKPEPTTPESPSVFDFLYQDSRRVGALLAQFDLNGVLTSITRADNATSTLQNEFTLGGGINVFALKAEAGDKETETSSAGNASSRVYDPLWRNSLALLSYLDGNGMLRRGLEGCRLGNLVLLTGTLEVFDVPILKTMFSEADAFRKVLGEAGSAKNWQETKRVLKILASLPLSVQALMHTEGQQVWMPLVENCMEIAATNLFLKYGHRIHGQWSVLGLLDALPEAENSETKKDEAESEKRVIIDVMRDMTAFASKFGRPQTSYSITPLLILRRVEV